MISLGRRTATRFTLMPWIAALAASALLTSPTHAANPPVSVPHASNAHATPWWKSAVFYQVYPRSFKDSNGDGIGDLNGLIEKLDYLKTLGINAIWINPHYDSPNKDNGYDVRDYRKVMKEFGTLEDFDRLVAEMKKRDMRLMIDIVVNHSSDENPWFVESRSSKDSPYREYYIWKDGKGEQLPNNYPSFFGGPAWKLDPQTQQYFLHYFAPCQPDLNWQSPKLRHEIHAMMRFWLDRGVAGLRFDSINTFAKLPGLKDLTPEQMKNFAHAYTEVPQVHEYIREMNREVFSKYDVVTAGELFATPANEARLYTDKRRHELNTSFVFDVIRLGMNDSVHWKKAPWTIAQLRHLNSQRDQAAGEYAWNTYFLGNHDNPRAVSHFGDPSPEWRARSAKALATMLLTQRATPFIFQGDELGMTNYPFHSIDEFKDIEAHNLWHEYVKAGKVTAEEFMSNFAGLGRDNSRTPIQWNKSAQGGFTTGTPWLPVNPNYKDINAEDEVKDPDSVFNFYRQMIALRRETPALVEGQYRDLNAEGDAVYAYTRSLDGKRYLIVINFSHQPQHYALPKAMSLQKVLISNVTEAALPAHARELTLAPWQSGVYLLD